MIARHAILLLLAGVLVMLVPVAHANPPDQTWIPGLYDDADHDDAVLAVTDATGFPAVESPALFTATLSPTRITIADPTRLAAPPRISPRDRGPPLG